ncbi:GNAT family N-acetyltransferase [Vibrio palustris]|uniref:Putative acetyltransferase n=1 Tax=Vibrio palustris TaxID=1918946 RepID=A0A1R4B6S9_9VIBR|nr:GNAT family N-acetyltransferase [Vibrio palustris]SJL84625.1 putative acetyltransferase [Vibrio palustris]
MQIIPLQPQHLDEIKQLYLESRLATFTWLDTSLFELSDFERETEGEDIWVACESNEVLGFISIWAPDSFIHHLYVKPSNLRIGIGLTLLNFAKQHYSHLSLKCFTQNSRAIDFYLAQGFTVGERVDKAAESYYVMHCASSL